MNTYIYIYCTNILCHAFTNKACWNNSTNNRAIACSVGVSIDNHACHSLWYITLTITLEGKQVTLYLYEHIRSHAFWSPLNESDVIIYAEANCRLSKISNFVLSNMYQNSHPAQYQDYYVFPVIMDHEKWMRIFSGCAHINPLLDHKQSPSFD